MIYTLINNKERYEVHEEKKTTFGRTCLLKSPGGNWIVANGVNFYSPILDGECHGDWNHGHYFMDNFFSAFKYYREVK